MAERFAVRNIRLCTKDCLCLYVCPTGAADTENSIIDTEKCIGCGRCADGCPSGAISMVPRTLPPQQEHREKVTASMRALMHAKAVEESTAAQIPDVLAAAMERSSRIQAEDLIREAGYMLPQSGNAHAFLQKLVENPPSADFPKETAEKLLRMIPDNEEVQDKKEGNMKMWKCTVCGYIYEGETLPEDYVCPVCKAPASKFEEIKAPVKNSLAGTKTEKNLQEAFAGESQARNKYTYFAEKAREEGYEQIANIFLETARNEQEHAKLWFRHLNGGSIPATADCLQMGINGENGEWTTMYANMAKDAREEGFTQIAMQMEMVAKIEKEHEERYQTLLNNVKGEQVFAKEEPVVWQCEICGFTLVGKTAPKRCPLCGYAGSFFEVKKTNY